MKTFKSYLGLGSGRHHAVGSLLVFATKQAAEAVMYDLYPAVQNDLESEVVRNARRVGGMPSIALASRSYDNLQSSSDDNFRVRVYGPHTRKYCTTKASSSEVAAASNI